MKENNKKKYVIKRAKHFGYKVQMEQWEIYG